jgi:DNA mismatch repair protein MutH
MELVCLGQTARISARQGIYLQIRPKAASSHELRPGIGEDGAPAAVNPRGFYLRSTFTTELLRRHYALPDWPPPPP